MRSQYVRALSWGMQALTGLGAGLYPVTDEENLFVIVVCMIGCFIFAYLLGEVFNALQVINAPAVRFASTMNELDEYINVNGGWHK